MKNRLAILMILLVMLPMIIFRSFTPSSVLATPIVSTNKNITNESHGQNEPNIAINPLHNRLQPMDIHVAVGANDYRGGRSVPGLYTSTDLTTWTYHSVSKPTYNAYGNPVLAYDSAGNLYYAYMAFQVDLSGNAYNAAIYVSKSTDEGATWSFYTRVSSLGSGSDPYNDRPWLAIDRSTNYIYVTWTLWHGKGASCIGSDIMFARSTNGGVSFSVPTRLSSDSTITHAQVQWSQVVVGSPGKVYVTWRRFGLSGFTRAILMAKSTNYGSSFGAETIVIQYPNFNSADYRYDGDDPATCTWPQLAYGPEGNLYIAWHTYISDGNRDLNFIRSTNDGTSWSSKIAIASNIKDQFWPALAISPTGRIDAVWYDRRDDINNQLVNLYYTNSTNKGATFDPNIVKVTTATSDTSVPYNPGAGRYFGDYIDLAETSDGAALAVWTDTRTGNQEIFISAISQPAISLSKYYFYLMTNTGVVRVDSAGVKTNLINAYGGSYSISILGDKLYVPNPSNGAIMIYNLQGTLLGSVTPALAARQYLELTALPKGRFALFNNRNDKVYFINSAGSLLATANILDQPDNQLQNLCGIVVGNKLVLSENGKKQIIQFDLTTYARTILRDLSGLPGSWLSSIAYANSRYYVCTSQSIYSFTSSTSAIFKVADIPEYSLVGISVFDSYYAYVALNYAGKIYMVNLATGASTVLASGLNYPKDMASTTGIIFADGFESGGFSAWTGKSVTTGETATVVNTMAHHGTYSAKFTSNGNGGFEYASCYKSVSSLSEVYARGYFRVAASGIVDNGDRISFIAFANVSGYYAAYAGWCKIGGVLKWSLVLGSTVVYSTSSPSLNTWYCVELHWKKGTTTGLGELYVNGVKVCSITGKNTAPYGSISQAIFGLALRNCASATAYCDCTKIAIKYIGRE